MLIKVFLLPKIGEDKLSLLYEKILEEVHSLRGLENLSDNEITVVFPPDLMEKGLGNEIVVEIIDIPNMKLANDIQPKNLLIKIGSLIKIFFPKAKIDCFHIVPADTISFD